MLTIFTTNQGISEDMSEVEREAARKGCPFWGIQFSSQHYCCCSDWQIKPGRVGLKMK